MSDSLQLPIVEVVKTTSDSIAIYFEPSSEQIADFQPGQFLTFNIHIDGKSVRRSYSICTAPSELPRLGVCVKRVDGGLMSNFLNDYAEKGAVLEVMKPYGGFTLNSQLPTYPPLVFIAAGSGITPVLSMIKTALLGTGGPITLIYGNTHQNTIIFKSELDALAAQHSDRLTVLHVLSRPQEGWDGVATRLTPEFLGNVFDFLGISSNLGANYYLCGPQAMMDGGIQAIRNLGVSSENIHKESFYSDPKDMDVEVEATASFNPDEPTDVTIIFEGQTHQIQVTPGQFILDACIDSGLDLPYACQMGICGMCRATKEKGSMKISDQQESLSMSEIEAGACLTCCAVPASNDLVINYDVRV
jgi:ring-1,2-phenylacetyl-CoA epoxidase subunit PaaE